MVAAFLLSHLDPASGASHAILDFGFLDFGFRISDSDCELPTSDLKFEI